MNERQSVRMNVAVAILLVVVASSACSVPSSGGLGGGHTSASGAVTTIPLEQLRHRRGGAPRRYSCLRAVHPECPRRRPHQQAGPSRIETVEGDPPRSLYASRCARLRDRTCPGQSLFGARYGERQLDQDPIARVDGAAHPYAGGRGQPRRLVGLRQQRRRRWTTISWSSTPDPRSCFHGLQVHPVASGS